MYWKAGEWGVHLPFSPFIKEVLTKFKVAPTQFSSVAWCILNSFDALFSEHRGLFGEDAQPTLNLFLEYYDVTFAPKSKSWISFRRRSPHLFKTINKIDDWSLHFFYMRQSDKLDDLLGGVPKEWNFSVTIPGREELSEDEAYLNLLLENHLLGCFHRTYLLLNIFLRVLLLTLIL